VNRYLDNGVKSGPVGGQRVFNQAIMDQLIAAVNECKQPGRFPVLQLQYDFRHLLFIYTITLSELNSGNVSDILTQNVSCNLLL